MIVYLCLFVVCVCVCIPFPGCFPAFSVSSSSYFLVFVCAPRLCIIHLMFLSLSHGCSDFKVQQFLPVCVRVFCRLRRCCLCATFPFLSSCFLPLLPPCSSLISFPVSLLTCRCVCVHPVRSARSRFSLFSARCCLPACVSWLWLLLVPSVDSAGISWDPITMSVFLPFASLV